MPTQDAEWLKYLLTQRLITAEQYQQWIMRDPLLDLHQLLMKHAGELDDSLWLDQALQLDDLHWLPETTETPDETLRYIAHTIPTLLAWCRQHYAVPLQAQHPMYLLGMLHMAPEHEDWKKLSESLPITLLRVAVTPRNFAQLYPRFLQQAAHLCI